MRRRGDILRKINGLKWRIKKRREEVIRNYRHLYWWKHWWTPDWNFGKEICDDFLIQDLYNKIEEEIKELKQL